MDSFQDAHYFSLPSQGNVYCYVDLSLTSGLKKSLFAILKRRVFCCEFASGANGTLVPVIKEIPFTYIPAGAEIISMDGFNKSSERDDFLIGISIIKEASDQGQESFLNVYMEQESDEKGNLNLENLAQNCLMIELNFIPYQLYHTYVIHEDGSKEVVWLLPGSDLVIHVYQEDPQNHTYSETNAVLFPEFNHIEAIVLAVDIKFSRDLKKRFSAIGCECGLLKLFMSDPISGDVYRQLSEYYDAPVSQVRLFSFDNSIETSELKFFAGDDGAKRLMDKKDQEASIHLLAVNVARPSAVFIDVRSNGLSKKQLLPESNMHDSAIACHIADIDMDGKPEILIGTYLQMLLVYKFGKSSWELMAKRRFSHAIHDIDYIDLSYNGVKELVVCTASGIHIYQHQPAFVLKKFHERLEPYLKITNPAGEDETTVAK
ncbi:Kaptin (Actin Hypothetical protein protein) [Nesidiocoris tenuis]|uniref:Kaptin n=1 Tax=Nesidiocoris tenuis TaxID=355587 RepID=A0ABN7AHW2_9HEMI|nr:Kaptin (Actin Hypothetical protein protein) [Nesidiocoris tenuis]